jgi:Fe-Mn family superoxide dismutase
MTMETTLPTTSTRHARHGTPQAMALDDVRRIGGLSRIVDRDIEILRMNLVQIHHGRYDTRSIAWERLESAWQTVRTELTDDNASGPRNENDSPANGATGAVAEVAAPVAVVPAVQSTPQPRSLLRWPREVARRVELRNAGLKIRTLVSDAAAAGSKHVIAGWRRLHDLFKRRVQSVPSVRSVIGDKWQTWRAARSATTQVESPVDVIAVDPLASHKIEPANVTYHGNGSVSAAHHGPGAFSATVLEASAHARLESAREKVKSKLVLVESSPGTIRADSSVRALDEPATSPDLPFAVKPLPWVLGALSPVISSRTMMMHHGSHYSRLIESANRLVRNHRNLVGKTPLEILRWARTHASGTELLATASEAWNHSIYWESLTPATTRPSGELRKVLFRMFGDFSDFADQFALAGASHVGSGWLWLTANRRKQLRILTTSNVDCPEGRGGQICLLAIDLWEHAYFLDHQNRRREYLDALIDRRLDWEFAEQRFRLALQPDKPARPKSSDRTGDRKRTRHPRQKRKAAASRR